MVYLERLWLGLDGLRLGCEVNGRRGNRAVIRTQKCDIEALKYDVAELEL